MVSAGVLVEGQEIRLGTLTFIADDSAWLQEAPLDVDALPVRGATHFRACVRGVLLRQPSTQYRSAPPSSTLPVSRQRKRSGRSRLQRWVRHAVARQSATTQVAAIEPDESLYGLFDLSTGSVETASECGSSDPMFMAEVAAQKAPDGYETMDVDFVPASGSPMVQADQRFNLAILKEDREAEAQLDAECTHAAAIKALLQVEPDIVDVNRATEA